MVEKAVGMRIKVGKNGPYIVTGDVPLYRGEIVTNDAGESVAWRQLERIPTDAVYALCRCGQSSHKPFCDSAHAITGFDGTETASRTPFADEATCSTGPAVKLLDARQLCAEARYCDRAGGLWNLVERSDEPDVLELIKEMASLCPAGRYIACDPDTTAPLEPEYEPSIWLIEDPSLGVSGPIWVRGGIEIVSSDGTPYEARNRVTLCRCGHSANKPLCDGSHITKEFHAI